MQDLPVHMISLVIQVVAINGYKATPSTNTFFMAGNIIMPGTLQTQSWEENPRYTTPPTRSVYEEVILSKLTNPRYLSLMSIPSPPFDHQAAAWRYFYLIMLGTCSNLECPKIVFTLNFLYLSLGKIFLITYTFWFNKSGNQHHMCISRKAY